MAELRINWETMPRISPPELKKDKVVTGETATPADAAVEDAPAAPSVSDKPFMVYVTDGVAATGFDPLEKVVLDDDKVKLGSHMFHPVKMSPEEAKEDPLLAEKGGKAVPRIVFVSADYKSVKVLEGGALKLGEVWGAMKATSDKHYAGSLDATVKDLLKVLIEFDKINNARKVLEDKETRVKDKPAELKAIEKERAELDAKEKKANEQKDALYALKVKGAKAAA